MPIKLVEHPKLVRLNSHQGEITRAVVEEVGDLVVVCTEAEYHRARLAGHLPVRIGFRRRDVIEEIITVPGAGA